MRVRSRLMASHRSLLWPSIGVIIWAAGSELAGCSSSSVNCATGLTDCGAGLCADLSNDAFHCGNCQFFCAQGATCQAGICGCPGTQVICGNSCVDTQTTATNCGGCGHDCGSGACSAGICQCGTYTDCGTAASPQCVDTTNDANNCNGCGLACTTNEVCQSSNCLCPAPFSGCAISLPTACVDLQTDPANCGGCSAACLANEVCAASSCYCSAPFTLCGTGSSEVCVNAQTDSIYCGSCTGLPCMSGESCTNGICCAAGDTACDGVCVDTDNDAMHCGSCTSQCPTGATCVSGNCLCGSTGNCTCSGSLPLCSKSCCTVGTACCTGGTCPLAHSNGLNATYADCNPLNTFNVATAIEAATAWQSSGTDASRFLCGTETCFARQAIGGQYGQCGVWCYSGVIAGSGDLNAATNVCSCPETSGTTSFIWN